MRILPERLLKVLWNWNRVPEILRCRRHTEQWLIMTSAYVGLRRAVPSDITISSGTFEFCELSDVATFWQIFYRRIYPVRKPDRLIVDAGANIGAFTLYALQHAPQAKVIAVEPAPDSCTRIRAMLRAHNLESRCTLHQVALAGAMGETSIDLNVASQFRRAGTPGARVRTVTLDSLIPAETTVDLVKMDIEGAEYEVLQSLPSQTMRRISRVVLEFHPNASYLSAIKPLTANGFRMILHRDDGAGYGIVLLERQT